MATYQNPVARAGDFADPFVLRHDGRYYLYCTNPDVRCWSSNDLVTWQLEGPTIGEDVFPGLVPFAPEVVYAGGFFFMYTSPSGQGHFVLRSESPTGPFVPVSGNVGHAIDGNVLIDDDGRWYFYWAGDEGIWGCEMASPTDFGEPVFTGIHMNGWTEGPFVSKRDGVYSMTLTGNHYLSRGYRIDAAWSDHPLTGYRADPLNPILISTSGPRVGLGHSSSVSGPDLVSTYIAYHNLNPDASRDLDIDRQVWSGSSLQVLGPTMTARVPSMPDEWCDWGASVADRWVVSDGHLEARDFAGMLLGEGAVAQWNVELGETFTAELNLTGVGHGLVLDDHFVQLPEGVAEAALHCWKIIQDDRLRIWVDERAVSVARDVGVKRLGIATGAAPVRLGHIALTRTTAAVAERVAPKPAPGRFWASLGTGGELVRAAGQPYDEVRLRPGEEISYKLQVQSDGPQRVYLAGDFESGDLAVDLRLDDGELVIRGMKGTPTLALVTVMSAPDGTSASVEGEEIEGYGKRLLGDATWDDLTIDATVSVAFGGDVSHADLLLRATQLSEGGEGDDTRLGINFLLGYSVQLHRDHVVLARHAYDERVLATHPFDVDPSISHQVRLRVHGGTISVELDGLSLFDVHDPLPYPAGSVGIRTSNARLHVERLELAAGGRMPDN
ncbi:glycoside hydrolase family 43 protein [Diaminobutyricibacter sp. McL0608]|uniref:glycoside hydrolase family 43 protein n=1 Tax=Leifsonia sp. McL0608 TaxID=3143537 RepID=UPI0031F2F848